MNNQQTRERWERTHHLINGAQRILLSTHVSPDGDGLGSQAALYEFLSHQGKECRIINPSRLPQDFRSLFHDTPFEQYNHRDHADWVRGVDLAIVFDVGDYARLDRLGEDFLKFGTPTLSIDHHPHPSPNGFAYFVHDISACATGYLVYEYIKYANERNGRPTELSKEMAVSLYVALMTDTGSFRFSNTSAEAHEMASELVRRGVKPYDVYEKIYESSPIERVRLLASALETVQTEGEGQVAWFIVTRRMIERARARSEYVSGFTDLVRTIQGVEVALMFHELSERRCRVNFRSKSRIRIHKLARSLGGGGHAFAAGATLELSLGEAIQHVVPKVLAEIKAQSASENSS